MTRKDLEAKRTELLNIMREKDRAWRKTNEARLEANHAELLASRDYRVAKQDLLDFESDHPEVVQLTLEEELEEERDEKPLGRTLSDELQALFGGKVS